MSTLDRAFSFVQTDHVAVSVAHDLHFDVLAGFDVLLDDAIARAEESGGFRLRPLQLSVEV